MRRCLLILLATTAVFPAAAAFAADVYGVRFDPPRLYLAHASLNKSGTLSALKGQDNFITIYMPPVDKTKGQYKPDQFSLSLLLPAFVEVPDQAEQGLTVQPVQHEGRPYVELTMPLDPVKVKARCFDNTWGVNFDLWYRVKEGAQVPVEPQPVQLTLRHQGQECFIDKAKLKVYEALQPGPRVSPRNFRLWLHYGPHLRKGHWDELAQTLKLAGINGVQVVLGETGQEEYLQAMRQRGFYIIAQRGGSYESLYKDNMRACLEQGPAWFAKADDGTMPRYLPHSDAALWDFEPSPLPTKLDPWLIGEFRKAQGLPEGEPLDEGIIRAKYLRPWIEFRQQQLATCIKHWGDYCRSVKPDVETILTEGSVLAFDPTGGVDYSKYQDYVTFCDPMNFTGLQALQVMQKWQQAAPRAKFTGCQNVALSSFHNVFVSPQTIMMQTLSAALIGLHGTSVYPGPAMDAENYVLWARVTEFLGRQEKLIFESGRDPDDVTLALIPKEEQVVTLGDGRKLRNSYPDWEREAITRSYGAVDGSEYLTVIANWHAKEPAYGQLALKLPPGQWLLVDDENHRVLTQDGKPQLDAKLLGTGVTVFCPAFDYRGFRAIKYSPEALAALKSFQPQSLEQWAREAQAYAQPAAAAGGAAATGSQTLTFDDSDGDGKFEYLVKSAAQKVWVSQNGTIARWQIGERVLEGEGLGLGRDMLWLPLGERENRGMDMVMRLEEKQVKPEGITLTFSKDVPLATLGGGASLRLTKQLIFGATPGEVQVLVRLSNTSVAPEATRLLCSYRVHNYLKYGAAANVLWASDGDKLQQWDKVEGHYTIPNTGLSNEESAALFAQCEVTPPLKPVSFGEYRQDNKLLLKITPGKPEDLLQILRWGRKAGLANAGTLEWMMRPAVLAVGQDLTYDYRLTLQPNVSALDAASAKPHTAPPQGTEDDLLFHLGFDGTVEPTVARGEKQVTVTGTPVYEDTPTGKGLRLSSGVSLSYLPKGNIDLQRGRLAIRYKPLYEGADGQTHYLLTVRPKSGFVYAGKLNDGRFLMNMFDAAGKQHYGWHLVRNLQAGTWHEVVCSWDATKGTMLLVFDGEKVAEHRGEPWQMAPLDNALAHSRLVLPETAEAVIDNVKIYSQP
ncbi:MAG: hypothetical protein ACYC63_01975 [Armatimonadota bacterium]